MRVVVKGGIFTNAEDEILKAAIAKYGKNQWARISSLLVRKTPKQCKARWYEWLDPSIRKTEWSRDEDEKLLHLAKLMPTQWRTIAPIVGRTANQCLERYQKLLDDAEQRDNDELGLTGTAEAGPSADDVRRLRPGEVDPNPEVRAARPDPIDMDEDEKEMLSEARARLANTQGKKAKRKARERQLEDARRLAMLQKKRELKAAGIQSRFKVKQKGMDYNADIPFEKAAAPGFYDTTEEAARVANLPIGKSMKQLEGGKRKQDMEEAEKRKKQKKAKDAASAQAKEGGGGAMANFLPAKDQQIQKLKEEQQIGKRRKLQLPGAQVSEQELEEIVKIGQAGESARIAAEEGGNEAGRGLLGEYSALGHAKDARTPRTAPQADNVMAEARNLRSLTTQQTPLLGDENADLHELVGRSGFEAATPSGSVQATPNPLATPFRRPGGGEVEATPRSVRGMPAGAPGATPLRTPMRDSLAINTPYGETPVSETPREQKQRLRSAQSSLQAAFASLPKPKNDFELVVPEDDDDDMELDGGVPLSVEDAAERDARNAARKAEEQRKALARRSQAVKLGLPRPVNFDPSSLLYDLQNAEEGSPQQELERIIAMEMVKLLEHDSIVHPVPGGSRAGGGKSKMEQIPDADLDAARTAVTRELGSVLGFPGSNEGAVKRAIISQSDLSAFDSVWNESSRSLTYDASSASFVEMASLSKEEIAKGQAALLDMYKKRMTADASKAAKTEKKLGTLLGGYQARSKKLAVQLSEATEALREATLQLECFVRLAENETTAIPRRLEQLQKEVRDMERIEREGQNKYRDYNHEKTELSKKIEDMEMEYAEAVNEAALNAMEED